MILLVIPAVWLALIVVLVALCATARRGDTDAAERLHAARAQSAAAEHAPVTAGALEQRRAPLGEPVLAGTRRAA
jgi:hypothetical protein